MRGFGDQTKPKKNLNSSRTKKNLDQILGEALKNHSEGNILKAKKYYQYLINNGFQDTNVFNNYAMILINQGQFTDAELLIRKAIEINPLNESLYLTLGGILKQLGKLKDAELLLHKAIKLNPKNAITYSNLGAILIELGYLKKAMPLIQKAIELKPDYANAHYNLGNILIDIGPLKEAELSIRKAINLNPNHHDAHLCLGIILRELGNWKEAELSIYEALRLKPDLAACYQNLSLLNYANGNFDLAFENIEKANSIDSISLDNQLLLSIFRKKKYINNEEISKKKNNQLNLERSFSFPIILSKPVDPNLINSLYKISALDLNKLTDPSFGKARGSNYKLFEDNEKITQEIKKELTIITREIFNSEVFFRDSFFTILGGKSTINKHNHLGKLDKFSDLKLWKKKYSLVYYLSAGDQNCKNPGILKFYKDKNATNSNEEITPSEGMIVIFPADRYHSVKYDGNKDRIIVGVNFYII